MDEDAAIERAAVALAWDARPVLTVGPAFEIDPPAPEVWWRRQPEMDRRRYLHRARIVIEAWERTWEEQAHAAE